VVGAIDDAKQASLSKEAPVPEVTTTPPTPSASVAPKRSGVMLAQHDQLANGMSYAEASRLVLPGCSRPPPRGQGPSFSAPESDGALWSVTQPT